MGKKLTGSAVAVALAVLVFASSASGIVVYNGNSVSFTKAIATPDWSKTSFSGTVNYTSCNTGCKSWLVLIFAEPSVYKCEAEDWLVSGDPNIRQVWNSLSQTGNKGLPFEQTEVSLIPGVLGQRLCVIGIQTTYSSYWEQDLIEETLIGQTLLTPFSPPPPPPPAPPPTPPVEEPTKLTVSKACLKAKKKVKSLTSRLNAARKEGKSTQHLNKGLREAKGKRTARC
jgi:hypothetical protein